MPRDSGGLYFLPAGNPVVPLTVIESDWANPTMSDVGQSLTDSLSRSGKGGMLSSLRGLDGSAAVPAWSWTNEPSTGRYRAGPGQVVESVLGQPVVRYLATGLEQWDQNTMSWIPLTPRDALGTPFNPASSNLDSTNVQDAIEEVNLKTGGVITADSVSYDDSAVYFPATTVQQAIDRIGTDIPGLANDILDNSDAILIVEGDQILLTNRVTQTEIETGTNTNNIALNAQQINANITDITTNRNDITDLSLEDQNLDSRITTNANNIDFVFGLTQDNADDITTNFQNIAINAAAISQNETLINNNALDIFDNTQDITANTADIAQNASDIIFTYNITQSNLGLINTNTSNISNNTTTINNNTSRIGVNENDLANFGAIFPGGVLLVGNGGTGVTSSTGTGNTVRSNSPTLTGFPSAPTQATSSNSIEIATTGFVKAQNYGQCYLSDVSNANGQYAAVRRLDTGGVWNITQSGRANLVQDPGTTVYFPVAYNSANDYDMTIAPYVAGVEGLNTSPGIETRYSNRWVGIHVTTILNGFVVFGTKPYSLAFASIPESGDRYYNKVLKTEHIEQMDGPWEDDPNVVILSLANTFWGPPLWINDEVLTYDIDDLPLGRVPRVKPIQELMGVLLRDANLTHSVLDRALLWDSRGNSAPLIAFNAALDILIGANPYTEAQFLEIL
jgi:hypothetical protein